MKITKTLLSKTQASSVFPPMIVLCLAFGQPLRAFTQTQVQPDVRSAKLNELAQPMADAAAHESSTSSAKPTEAPKRIEDPEALAKELEAMKLRIEQLEAELKVRMAAEQPATATASDMVKRGVVYSRGDG